MRNSLVSLEQNTAKYLASTMLTLKSSRLQLRMKRSWLSSMRRRIQRCRNLWLLRLQLRRRKKITNHPRKVKLRPKTKIRRQSKKEKKLTRLNKSTKKWTLNLNKSKQMMPKTSPNNSLKQSKTNRDQLKQQAQATMDSPLNDKLLG